MKGILGNDKRKQKNLLRGGKKKRRDLLKNVGKDSFTINVRKVGKREEGPGEKNKGDVYPFLRTIKKKQRKRVFLMNRNSFEKISCCSWGDERKWIHEAREKREPK